MASALTARIADARRLRSEAERVNPAMAHATWLNASLLDAFTEQRVEVWIEKHEDDEAAILERYQRSDERRDSAFMRLCERRYGLRGDDPNIDAATSARRKVLATPLCKAIMERQDARVQAADRERLQNLQTFEATYLKAGAEAFPTDRNMSEAMGAIVAEATR